MSVLFFVITIILIAISVACSVIFLWLNNFSTRSDIYHRNTSVRTMMQITMIAAMVTTLLSGFLSNSKSVEQAIQMMVTLYFIIAISMLVVILLSCIVLIYRFIARDSYPAGTSSGVLVIIITSTIGALISLIFAWFLS